MDLHLDLSATPGRSLRARAEHALREAVRSGRLAPGTRLPATRALAAELGVSRGVVVEAYAQLAAEGYLDTRRGGGTRVAEGGMTAVEARREVAATRVAEAAAFSYDMRPSLPSTDGFPRRAWLGAMARVLREVADERLGYGDRRGEPELREALAGWLARRRGVIAGPEQVVVTGGLRDALPVVWHLLREQGAERVGVEDPGWWRMGRSAEVGGLDVVRVTTDDEGIKPAELGDVDVVAVTPAHQFPTGAVLSAERRAELVAYVRARGAWLLEDDYDAEFRYDRQPIGSLQGLAPERTIHAGTTSKSLAPALRLGWLVLPSSLTAELHDDDPGSPAGTPPTLDQLALADLIQRGEVDRHLRRQRLRYAKRRTALLSELQQQLPHLPISGAAAGLFAVLNLPDGADEDRAAHAAAQEGVALEPLRAPNRAGLVLGYANLPEPSAPHAVRALVRALARTS